MHRNVHEVRRTAQLILNQSLVHDIHSLRWLVGRDITRVTTLATPNPDHVEHLLLTVEFEVPATRQSSSANTASPTKSPSRSKPSSVMLSWHR